MTTECIGMAVGTEIEIRPYHPGWPEAFMKARDELRAALGRSDLAIEHVGSTSVPGLAAKPVIDIFVAVPSLAQAGGLIASLAAIGFEYRPDDELPDRLYFVRSVNGLRCHHVSLAEPASMYARNTLTFRDALRRDPALAARYAALKKSLAAEVGTRRLAYLNGKTSFVLGVLQGEGVRVVENYPTEYKGSKRHQTAGR